MPRQIAWEKRRLLFARNVVRYKKDSTRAPRALALAGASLEEVF